LRPAHGPEDEKKCGDEIYAAIERDLHFADFAEKESNLSSTLARWQAKSLTGHSAPSPSQKAHIIRCLLASARIDTRYRKEAS
jgi:hypothetical protein